HEARVVGKTPDSATRYRVSSGTSGRGNEIHILFDDAAGTIDDGRVQRSRRRGSEVSDDVRDHVDATVCVHGEVGNITDRLARDDLVARVAADRVVVAGGVGHRR